MTSDKFIRCAAQSWRSISTNLRTYGGIYNNLVDDVLYMPIYIAANMVIYMVTHGWTDVNGEAEDLIWNAVLAEMIALAMGDFIRGKVMGECRYGMNILDVMDIVLKVGQYRRPVMMNADMREYIETGIREYGIEDKMNGDMREVYDAIIKIILM
jgi:hypothetical protein